MVDDTALFEVLSFIQARGHIGQPLADAVAHADRYVALIPPGCRSVVDLGSGGGLPALVIAVRRPDLHVTMVERRGARADVLLKACRTLGIDQRTVVIADDVRRLADTDRRFDVVTARSFAAPAITLRWAKALVVTGGLVLVSDPPGNSEAISARWGQALTQVPGMVDGGAQDGVHLFHVEQSAPSAG